jgi:hypothetical protein
MRSHLQIEASRRNSQKSTGPRTAAGKAASSRNSLNSGIYAESEIVGDENASDLQTLVADYLNRFHPDAPEQRCLIDILVHSEWTLRRLRRAEAQLWERYIELAAPSHTDDNPYPLGGAVKYESGKVFARLQHRITATQRNYERALKELLKLQADRTAQEPAAKLAPAPAVHATSVPLGFVSSPIPSPPSNPQVPPAAAQNRPAPSVTGASPCVSAVHPSP